MDELRTLRAGIPGVAPGTELIPKPLSRIAITSLAIAIQAVGNSVICGMTRRGLPWESGQQLGDCQPARLADIGPTRSVDRPHDAAVSCRPSISRAGLQGQTDVGINSFGKLSFTR